ncbi:MAG: hypothetical protein PUC00_06440 [Clostridiales bacterium]|nr:hypothetical protein [Clostridiales bacterium]
MTRKRTGIVTGLYALSAIVMTVVFFTHWRQDGTLIFSTVLFGVAALCFWGSAVCSAIQLCRMPKDDHASAKEEK